MAAPLSGRLPDVEVLKKHTVDKLRFILESASGKKDLFLDPRLMKPIDRIADIRFLKNHGVDKIYKLDTSRALQGNQHRFYIVKPLPANIRLICEQINAERSLPEMANRIYKIVMVPRSLYICEKILEEQGVYGHVTKETLPFYILPVDQDILTMELDDFHSSCFINEDETLIHTAASALVDIQMSFGRIHNFYAIGSCAKRVWELSNTLLSYNGDISTLQPQIGQVIIIDRDCDYVTPLCSQVTYEGLLDDTFGIRCGVVELGSTVTGAERSIKLPLNSSDEFFEEIRNRHFSTVYKFIVSRAKQLQQSQEKTKSMSVSEMKEFVARELKVLQSQNKSLSLHLSACEEITKQKTKGGHLEDLLSTEHGLLESRGMTDNITYIENCMHQEMDKTVVLRLLCLLSLVKDGLSPERYDALKTIYLQTYGYEHIVTFHTLNKAGLFVRRELAPPTTVKTGAGIININTSKLKLPKKSSFQMLSKNLQLIPKEGQDIDLRSPTEMSYVFSGAYTPLSCRLVEMVLQNRGFAKIEESIKLMTSCYDHNVRPLSVKGGRPAPRAVDETVLVYFLGGVSYSEIAALRFLSRVKGRKFLILTTDIISGDRFLQKLVEI